MLWFYDYLNSFFKLVSKNRVDRKQIEQGSVSFGYKQLANCEEK